MSVKVNIFAAIIGSVLLPNNKFVAGFPTSIILGTKSPTYPEHNSPCNVVDDQPNVINESRTDSSLDISERTAELISNIKAITKYMSEHSKVLSVLCEKKTTLPGAFDTAISERASISDNKATDLYIIYLEQLNAFASTIHNFNDQCTQDYDSDLIKQLQDFRQRIQSTPCAVEIGLRGMGLHETKPVGVVVFVKCIRV
ncbi:uncharacterized protein LOC127851339 isoform X2 [Dreissena polymorpha]|uniref:uncharacterized protein LOC127851339 isoform X2 n=1 Tax=Dreissena polymorpha TaxID=45954 RepID=UPI002265101E|nr:uncharacterized protein LOC127851339 isoform X2 [Dreissena polymorpha]